jgi:superfamily II DNA or RNA helicase
VSFSWSPGLWVPQERGLTQTVEELSKGSRVCLYGPTGSGKTTQAYELMRWAESRGRKTCFYVNRRLLLGQTYERFTTGGLYCGIRAADYGDKYCFGAPHQICSADTERSRVFTEKMEDAVWRPHDAGLIIIDETHIQKTETMRRIMDHYESRGAMIVGLTATPVGLSDWYDKLVISGSMAEYRDCKALVPAVVKSIEQPDLSRVKRNATGEYVLDGQKRKIYTQTIVGSVIARWKQFNPHARPTMLFAPGKAESVWFTEQFEKIGVPWVHVDATEAVVDGKRATLTRALWDEIVERYKDGSVKGLSCRFKLREGIDLPATYHAILATPIGSLASYVQTVGRVLRYSPETPDEVLITDHGGNYWRHGSPNRDRDWEAWWTLPEHAISNWRLKQISEGKMEESIVCPVCFTERLSGIKCPKCSHTHEKSKRHVVMEDGRMVTKEGKMVPRKRIKTKPDTDTKWMKMYYGYARSKTNNQSFEQMYAFFQHENGYCPPRDLPFMPKRPEHWYCKVKDLDPSDLHTTETSRKIRGVTS